MDENEIIDGHQAEEVIEDAPVEEESAPVEESETETPAEEVEQTPEEEFDEIKYNKETVRIPKSERQTYLQKGYNYDKVNEKATKFETDLQRVAKFSGFDNVDDFLQAVAAQEEEQRIADTAARMGVDPSVVREQIAPMEQKLRQYESEMEVLRQAEFQRNVVSTINELKQDERYKDFDAHAEPIFAFMKQEGIRPTKSGFEAAYKAVTYDTMRNNIEQQVLSNVAARDGKTVLSSSDKPADVKFDIANMSSEEFKQFEAEMSRRAAMGERVSW